MPAQLYRKANAMDTTLWFSDQESSEKNHMLDMLVIAGQVTMCNSVLAYIKALKKDLFHQLSPPEDPAIIDGRRLYGRFCGV